MSIIITEEVSNILTDSFWKNNPDLAEAIKDRVENPPPPEPLFKASYGFHGHAIKDDRYYYVSGPMFHAKIKDESISFGWRVDCDGGVEAEQLAAALNSSGYGAISSKIINASDCRSEKHLGYTLIIHEPTNCIVDGDLRIGSDSKYSQEICQEFWSFISPNFERVMDDHELLLQVSTSYRHEYAKSLVPETGVYFQDRSIDGFLFGKLARVDVYYNGELQGYIWPENEDYDGFYSPAATRNENSLVLNTENLRLIESKLIRIKYQKNCHNLSSTPDTGE